MNVEVPETELVECPRMMDDLIRVDTALRIVQACAEECSQQQSGEKSVFHMVGAWMYAWKNLVGRELTAADIIYLGQLVEPVENLFGWRGSPVRVGDYVAPPPEEIPLMLQGFLSALRLRGRAGSRLYALFEIIHPFIDGNGRVGLILYNLIEGTMDAPIPAPWVDWEAEQAVWRRRMG